MARQIFSRYTGTRPLDETSIDDIPLDEQRAYFDSRGWAWGEDFVPDEQDDEMYAAWATVQAEIGDDPNLPLGGHTDYGLSRSDFASEDAFRDAQCQATLQRYFPKAGQRPALYECGICGDYHPAGFLGDCRQDLFRIDDPDEMFGSNGWDLIDMEDAD